MPNDYTKEEKNEKGGMPKVVHPPKKHNPTEYTHTGVHTRKPKAEVK